MYLTAIVQQGGDGFVSWCPELDIASQGDTVEGATNNLQGAAELFLESADSAEVASRLKRTVIITHIEARIRAT